MMSHGQIIDITRLLDRRMQRRLPTGVDRVGLEYVRYFRGSSTALVRFAGMWIELPRKDSDVVFEALLTPLGDFIHLFRRVVASNLVRSFGRSFDKPRFLINTGHSGLDNQHYVQRLQHSRLRPLLFVHDLIPLKYPEFCRAGEALRHSARMNAVLQNAHGVIVNSAATLVELETYARANGLPMKPSVVALLAPAQLPHCNERALPLRYPYFVVLGTIEPRKNHWMLLQLWRQMVERLGNDAPRLVIIGQRGWMCSNVVDMLEHCEILKGFVYEQSACSDEELASWLVHARALLFPTFAEGYGMPLAEALNLSVPVIASDLPVFREFAQDIPEYVDPMDGRRWAELIAEYAAEKSDVREAQLQRMLAFEAPTWKTHFEQVEALLEHLRA